MPIGYGTTQWYMECECTQVKLHIKQIHSYVGSTAGGSLGTTPKPAKSGESSPAVAKKPSAGSPPKVPKKPAESPKVSKKPMAPPKSGAAVMPPKKTSIVDLVSVIGGCVQWV